MRRRVMHWDLAKGRDRADGRGCAKGRGGAEEQGRAEERDLSKERGRAKARGERGLTLIEIAVAVLILALGGLAALRSLDQSRLAVGQDAERVLARTAALNRAAELRLVGIEGAAGLPPVVELAGRRIALRVETALTTGALAEATITARGPSGTGAVFVTYVPAGAAP